MMLYLVSLSFASLFSLVLGAFVFYKNPASRVNRTWGLSCLGCCVWSLFFVLMIRAHTYKSALLFSKICNLSAAYMIVLVAHFCKEVASFNTKKMGLIKLGYLNGVLLTLSAFTDYFCSARPILNFDYFVSARPVYHLFTAHFFFYIFYSEYVLIRGMAYLSEERKNQIKYIIVALTSGYVGGGLTFLPAYGIPFQPVSVHFVWVYAAIISYAILKYQLMDIKVVIKKTLFYSLLVFLVSALYFMAVFMTHKLLISPWDLQTCLMNGLKGVEILSQMITKNLFTLTSFLCGVASMGLAVFGLIVGRTKAQRLFMVFNAAVAIWGFGNFVAGSSETSAGAVIGWRSAYIGGFFLSAIFCHLTQVFFEIRNRKILFIAYLQAIVFSSAMVFHPQSLVSQTRLAFGVHYNVITGMMATAIAMFLLIVIITYKNLLEYLQVATEGRQTQAKYFIFGFAFGFIGGATTLLPPFGIDVIYPAGNLGVGIYAFILVYAMFRHQILDVRIVIKRTIFYSLTTLFISIAYILVIFVLHKLFLLENIIKPTVPNSIILVVLIMVFLKPVEIFLHRFLDKKFFKGTITEIAKQKQLLETELERRERLKSVGILAAGMAHEIKNPITAIKTFAEYLPAKYDDPGFREKFSKIIVEESERVSRIVQDLLLFSKPSEPRRCLCDVHRLLRDTLDLLSGDILKNKITVVTDFDPAAGKSHVDAGQMKQAFLNLLMNAIEAMPNGGALKVSTSLTADLGLLITVSDTGPGISSDKLPHLFDPFFTDKDEGTGLGLAITHAIIEKNGGKITVQSAFGKGASFLITLPPA
ncbi:MAG: hypothetical protein HYZ52_06340 [Candidatus Omnitrophica bacterium]|nr:hypothetical protein [Candidatus Omnitrophota bacterium]